MQFQWNDTSITTTNGWISFLIQFATGSPRVVTSWTHWSSWESTEFFYHFNAIDTVNSGGFNVKLFEHNITISYIAIGK